MVLVEIGEDAIKALSSASVATHAQLEAIAVAALAVICGKGREESVLVGSVFQELDVDFIKKTFSAFVCLFLEVAKNDLSSSELLSFLRSECAFTDITGELVCHLFSEKKESLRNTLALTGNHTSISQVVGVDWKLDYCVSSSEDRALRELLFRVSLKTIDTAEGVEGKIEFISGVEELQDLVSRLKDACKAVERNLDHR